MVYLYLKLIHILFVIIFLGNITVGVFWKIIAERSKDPDKIAFTFKGIIKADRWFTMPGVLGILIFGIGGAAHIGYPLLGTGWILWSIILFSISGIAFMAKLVPLQKKLPPWLRIKKNSTGRNIINFQSNGIYGASLH